MAQNRQDIKKRFSVPLKGSRNKVFPVKTCHLKFSFSLNLHFLPSFQKNHVLSFLLTLASVISMVHSDSFLIM